MQAWVEDVATGQVTGLPLKGRSANRSYDAARLAAKAAGAPDGGWSFHKGDERRRFAAGQPHTAHKEHNGKRYFFIKDPDARDAA